MINNISHATFLRQHPRAESVVEAQTCSDLLQHSCPAAPAEARGLGFVLINVRLPLPHLLSLISPTLFCPAGYEPSSVPGLWAPPGGVAEPWGGRSARRIGFGGLCMKLVQWVWDAQAPFILEVNASSDVLKRWGGVKIFIDEVWAKSSWKDSFDCLLLRFGHFELKATPTWTLEKLRGWGALGYITLAASLPINWFPGLKFSFFCWFKTIRGEGESWFKLQGRWLWSAKQAGGNPLPWDREVQRSTI